MQGAHFLIRRQSVTTQFQTAVEKILKAAAVSSEKAVEMMKLTKKQTEVTMFAAGVGTLGGLKMGNWLMDHSE